MGFLSPWFLFGAAAIALPLWLHLLRQYKRTPQPFSSLMFFERRVQSSVKHRRLRYLVLLALRLALLVLLALAFASPFINRTSATAGKRTLTLIAIDRSFSMRSGDRMTQAKAEAHRLLNALPAERLAQVVTVDAHVEAASQPEPKGATLSAAVDTVESNDRASSFGEFARALRSIEQTSGMHLDVHLISDMQQTSMPSDFHDLQAGPHVTLQLHRVGERNRPNWAVENVVAPSEVDAASQNRLTATVAGWDVPVANRRVSLLLDGKEIAAKNVSLAANGQMPVEFTGFEVPYGSHHGEIRITPNDDLPQDDSFPFSIERKDARKVLFLSANNRGGFYYGAALESGSKGSLTVDNVSAADAMGQDFSKFPFVVLNDVGELDPKLSDSLCGYVQKGGSVLIVLGLNTARSGTIPLSKEQFSEQHQKQAAGYVDSGHPALAAAGRFENVQFSETASFAPKANAKVLAKFADGTPLLIEERAGEGRKLIFASALDNSTSDFALHSSFVPFVVQTARYLAGAEDNPSSVVAGTPVPLRHPGNVGTAADVIGPDGKHELALSEAAKALSFDVTRSGFYEITRADGRRSLVAVHADRRESNLESVPDETLELWRNTGDTNESVSGPTQRKETRPWSFWRYVLAAALFAALLESVFASRYLKEERQTA